MNDTKIRMMHAAHKLLLTKGVEATSVDEILAATKTGKSQFYHFFGSKGGMVQEILLELHKELAANQWNGHALPTLESWDMVRPWLEAIGGGSGDKGHPLALLSLSIRPGERKVTPLLGSLYETLRHPLLDFLLGEQAAGRLAQIRCVDLADLALTSMIGATIKPVACSLHEDTNSIATAAHHITLYLKAYSRA